MNAELPRPVWIPLSQSVHQEETEQVTEEGSKDVEALGQKKTETTRDIPYCRKQQKQRLTQTVNVSVFLLRQSLLEGIIPTTADINLILSPHLPPQKSLTPHHTSQLCMCTISHTM